MIIETTGKTGINPGHSPKPLYEQVKIYVKSRIKNGDWPCHSQIPSEHTLVREMGISRMTIHRALRELTQEGVLDRIQGVGTFVAKPPQGRITVEMKDIDQAIRDEGRLHQAQVHFHQAEPLSAEDALPLGLHEGDEVFRSYIVHRENGHPLMLEDRFVNPALLPDYLKQDFSRLTTSRYIQDSLSMLSHEQTIRAVLSTPETSHFLELASTVPCFQVNRKTWSGNKIVSMVRMVYSGDRYQLT
ncbi:UTRA domain-containing protein [Sneathiella chinensis]|uniref:Histidine utilization repressor n=1 Tax=Sneathiella chinensis TaxID=349750 RepID=A0ABQ5U6M0_9PROT|nr:UTRA domain-containing protein [Sneathiella chinensis]GLQ07800.1 histidine utilization repressor [Sneathiella chinensis]